MILRGVAIFWGLVVTAGLIGLAGYSARPGAPGDPSARWPSASRITLASDRPTLVLFLDPLCPCSRATLAELGRSLARCGSPVAAHVVVVGRGEGDEVWERPRIPGVAVIDDDRGAEMRRFGAVTSGHMLLYRRDGRLAFSGGITPARGHEGDSAGGSAVVDLANGLEPSATSAPVYGCPFFDRTPDSITGETAA